MNLLAAVPAAIGLLGFCVLAETLQQISFKAGAARAQRARVWARAILAQPLIWAGIALWAVEGVGWVLALQRLPLSRAYPLMTLSYVTVPLAGVLLLRERMAPRQLIGAALVVAGAMLVAASGA